MQRLNVMQMTDVTGRGGAEKALVDLALRIDHSKFNVSVCATRSAGNYQPLLDAAGVKSFILDRRTRWDMYKVLSLVKLLRRERIHIVHTHLFGANTWGRVLGKLAGVPVIISHEHWAVKSPQEVQIDRALWRLSDLILVPSKESKRIVAETDRIPARRLSVVYNGVDIAQFAPRDDASQMRRELGIAPGEVLIGTVARLTEIKGGMDVLIRAHARLRKTYPQVRLLIVGDGPLRTGLEKLAGDLGEPVIFTGVRNDVPRLLGAMDIFVLPTLNEALPIALLEAMATRLPVVATRVGGVHEMVLDGVTGFLVQAGNEDALHDAVERLVADPALAARLSEASQAFVQANFTLDQMARRVEQIYDALAKRKIKNLLV